MLFDSDLKDMYFLTVVVKVFSLHSLWLHRVTRSHYAGALVVKMPNSIHVVVPMITSIDLKDKKLEILAFLDQRSVAK